MTSALVQERGRGRKRVAAESKRASSKRGNSGAQRADPVTQYARDVLAGAVLAGRAVRLACERHLRDVQRQGTAAFPYVFDTTKAEDTFAFFREFLTLDDGSPFALLPWMQFVFGSLDGWQTIDGHRRFQTGYMETGKGSGKTPAAGGYGLKALADTAAPMASEIYSLGVDSKQAAYLFNYAKKMAERSPDLRDLLEIGAHNIAWLERYSFFRPLSAEGRSLDNKRPYLALVDELHEHPSSVIVDKMRLGFKGVLDALLLEFTNAGHDKTSICWEHHDYSIKVLEQVITDERWFAYICQLDPCEACRDAGATQPNDGCAACDHWTDEAVWIKANPSLGVTIPLEYLRGVVKEALNRPGLQPRVKRLNFCIWTQTHTIWIPPDRWDTCRSETVASRNPGVPCAAAFDMSAKLDLTSGVVALRFDDPPAAPTDVIELLDVIGDQEVKKTLTVNFTVDLIPFFWLPADTLLERVKNERIPYDVWAKAGHLRVTPGPVIDHTLIYDEFTADIGPRFKPSRVGYDPNNATMFAVQLRDRAKFTVVEISQGRKLSEAFKLFEALVRVRRIRHSGNPVMTWCVGNAEPKYDRYENLWVEKPSPTKRIDGLIAAVMALQQLILMPEAQRSVYETRGALLI
jgi:phage terminase large subunit-like protein